MCSSATARFRGFYRFLVPVVALGSVCLPVAAQTTSQCNSAGTATAQVAASGLAEKIGNMVITCTGGSSGNNVIANLYVTLNTNITNSLDANGNPQFITVTSSGAAAFTASPVVLTSATTLELANINYTVPANNATPVVITISGVRAAVASIQNGQSPALVNATFSAIGLNLTGALVNVALGVPSLLSSAVNNGISCQGSPLPMTTDFPSFVAAGTASSAVRITEAFATAFAPADATSTQGTRIFVQFSGYGAGVNLYVPDVLVGNSGTTPTSGGEFNSSIAGGTYTPNSHQLLLSRVSGTNSSGAGGTLVAALPAISTSFTSMSQLSVSGGAAYAVYEVLDDNPFVSEAVQVPVFVVTAANNCASSLQTDLTAMEAPVSTVSVATATDPVPRYVSAALGSDCQQTGDCTANYFPVLSISSAPVNLTGSSSGAVQSVSIPMSNSGGTQLNLTISVAYQNGSGWLTATPTSTAGVLALAVAANPASLQQGVYTATININAGEAGAVAIPFTFTVGPEGITIEAIVNAASFAAGPVAPGSYVALFGLDLTGTSPVAGANPAVTFNGLNASVVYSSATQINLIVPASLSGQSTATVLVSVNGQVSNSFTVSLAANEPGVFTPGILNSDNSVNGASNPAKRGTYVQVYLTGLATPVPANSVIVTIGSQTGIVPSFAGLQGTLPALDQVNVTIPASLVFTGNSVPLSVCFAPLPLTPQICSNSVSLYVQ